MKRYAFIDVQNTASTAEIMLGFVIDWSKLADFLKNKKSCTEVSFYTGIDQGDAETANEFDALAKSGCCVVRSKAVFAYKNRDKVIPLKCASCGTETVHTVNMGYNRKSNCDVELSVDATQASGPEVEIYLFTGDGDFEYLIRKALEKGVDKVYVVSYAAKETKAGLTLSRFSTKLRDLIAEKRDKVFYMSLDDIKNIIKKDIPSA